MLYTKDDKVLTAAQVEALHPNSGISPIELGYEPFHPMTPPDPELGVPVSITRAQGEQVLRDDGLYQAFADTIAQSDPITQHVWAEVTTFYRISPPILGMQIALGWTNTFVNDLFIRGSQITT